MDTRSVTISLQTGNDNRIANLILFFIVIFILIFIFIQLIFTDFSTF